MGGVQCLWVLLHWFRMDFSQFALVWSCEEAGGAGGPYPCSAQTGSGIWVPQRAIYCAVSFDNRE